MDKRLEDLFYAQQARQESDRIIRDAAGHDGNGPGGTYLVSSFRQRHDLPVTSIMRTPATRAPQISNVRPH